MKTRTAYLEDPATEEADSRTGGTPAGYAFVALVMLVLCLLAFQYIPTNRMNTEAWAPYSEAVATRNVMPLICSDWFPLPHAQVAYTAFPPLYNLLLFPFAVFGISYGMAVLTLNSLLALGMAALFSSFIRLVSPSANLVITFALIALSPGLTGNLTMAFAYFLVPLGTILTFSSYLRWIAQPKWPSLLFVIFSALVSGLSHWLCVLAATGCLFLFALLWVKCVGETGKKTLVLRSALWCGAYGLVVVGIFLLWLQFTIVISKSPDQIPFRSYGAMHTSGKAFTEVSGFAVIFGTYLTFIRASVVFFPPAFALWVSGLVHRPTRKDVWTMLLVLAAALTPIFFYTVVFPGEAADPSHTMLTTAWVIPSGIVLTFLMRTDASVQRMRCWIFMILLAVYSIFTYLAIPYFLRIAPLWLKTGFVGAAASNGYWPSAGANDSKDSTVMRQVSNILLYVVPIPMEAIWAPSSFLSSDDKFRQELETQAPGSDVVIALRRAPNSQIHVHQQSRLFEKPFLFCSPEEFPATQRWLEGKSPHIKIAVLVNPGETTVVESELQSRGCDLGAIRFVEVTPEIPGAFRHIFRSK